MSIWYRYFGYSDSILVQPALIVGVRDGKPMILPNFANSITFLLARII
jgi:hypothetical protein